MSREQKPEAFASRARNACGLHSLVLFATEHYRLKISLLGLVVAAHRQQNLYEGILLLIGRNSTAETLKLGEFQNNVSGAVQANSCFRVSEACKQLSLFRSKGLDKHVPNLGSTSHVVCIRLGSEVAMVSPILQYSRKQVLKTRSDDNANE